MNKKLVLLALGLLSLSGAAQAALIDRGGGLIYDDVLNVTWLQDANYAKTSGHDADGQMNWQNAVDWAANLSYYDSVRNVIYDDWRLPSVSPVNGSTFNYAFSYDGSSDVGQNIDPASSEMAHIFAELGNVSAYTTHGSLRGGYSGEDWGLVNKGPFTNFQSSLYWSGSWSHLDMAWNYYFYNGAQDVSYISSNLYALALRPGDVAAVPEPETYAMMLAGLGLVGFVSHRRKQKQAVCRIGWDKGQAI